MKIACSACLLGHNCKYNGKNNANPALMEALKEHETIPVCPEVQGGLSIPRKPCELQNGKVMAKDGTDCTAEYTRGAEECLEKIRDCDALILQSRSPSCGLHQVYDGTFSGTLIPGSGVFATLAKGQGINCMEADAFLAQSVVPAGKLH